MATTKQTAARKPATKKTAAKQPAAAKKAAAKPAETRKPAFDIPEMPDMDEINEEFTERSFVPLDDVWAEELKDLFDDF